MFNGRRYAYPKSPDLQKLRVNIDYSISGVSIDFMGPLYCENIYVNHLEDDEMHKCCGIFYTCATTRGVFLDAITLQMRMQTLYYLV